MDGTEDCNGTKGYTVFFNFISAFLTDTVQSYGCLMLNIVRGKQSLKSPLADQDRS